MTNKLLYAGYGANRDPEMIEAITGSTPLWLGDIVMRNVELCVQRLDQTPRVVPESSPADISVREILELPNNWQGVDFETYTIRRRQGGAVAAALFEVTPEQRSLIAEWEMIDYGWYQRMLVFTQQKGDEPKLAETEGLRPDQEIDRVVDGRRYATYLNDREKMFQVAEQTRRDFLARQG